MTRVVEFFKQEAVRLSFNYYFLFIYVGLSVGLSGPTLPALADQTGIRLGQMGYVFLLSSLGYTAGTLLGGRLFDRYRGHPVLGFSLLVTAACLFVIPIVPWFWLLLVIILIKGVVDGLLNGVNTLLVWLHGDKASPYMNALHFFFGVGAFIGPLVVARLLDIPLGYRWGYWGLATFALVMALRMIFLPGDPKPVRAHHNAEGAPVRVFYPLVFAALLYLFFYVGSEITFGGWIFTYASALKILDAAGAAYLTSGFWFSFTIGRLISIPIGMRFSPRQVIPLALAGCLGILVLVLLLPASPVLLWLVTLVLGFCMGPLWPMGFTLAGQSIKLTARISSIILMGDSLGGMVLPWLVGQIIDLTGARAMLPIVFSSLVLNLLAYIVMVRLSNRHLAMA